MRTWLAMTAIVVLAGCGGGEGGGGSPGDKAAQACFDHAKTQLGAKPFDLDLAVLAASMKDVTDGEKFLTAPIVIEPGMSSEEKQIVECTVRFAEGKDTPDVVGFLFNW